MHELGVVETLSLNSSADTCDPELSEISLSLFSAAVSVLACLCNCILCNAVIGASATEIAFSLVENFLSSVLVFCSVNPYA